MTVMQRDELSRGMKRGQRLPEVEAERDTLLTGRRMLREQVKSLQRVWSSLQILRDRLRELRTERDALQADSRLCYHPTVYGLNVPTPPEYEGQRERLDCIGTTARRGTNIATGRFVSDARVGFVLLAVLLLSGSCGSDTVTLSAGSHVAPAHPYVSTETAARYAKGLAKATWTELQLVSKEEAFANIHSHLQAFSDMTGCSVVASRRRQFSRVEYADFATATYHNVIAAVKCSYV